MRETKSEGARAFPSSHWSDIYLASQTEQAGGARALDDLLRLYLPPLLAHLQQQFRASEDDARDWLQGFIEKKVLQKKLLERADESKGKFRNFLLKALDNFVRDQRRRQGCPTRNPEGGTVPLAEMEDTDGALAAAPAANSFDLAWARAVLTQAEERTRAFYEAKQTTGTWAVFKEGFLLPRQAGEPRPSDAQLARRHGFASARQASNAIITAKREFGRQLRLVVGKYVERESEVDNEIRELIAILSEAG